MSGGAWGTGSLMGHGMKFELYSTENRILFMLQEVTPVGTVTCHLELP